MSWEWFQSLKTPASGPPCPMIAGQPCDQGPHKDNWGCCNPGRSWHCWSYVKRVYHYFTGGWRHFLRQFHLPGTLPCLLALYLIPHLKCNSGICWVERRGTHCMGEHSICKAKENQGDIWTLPRDFARESLWFETLTITARVLFSRVWKCCQRQG